MQFSLQWTIEARFIIGFNMDRWPTRSCKKIDRLLSKTSIVLGDDIPQPDGVNTIIGVPFPSEHYLFVSYENHERSRHVVELRFSNDLLGLDAYLVKPGYRQINDTWNDHSRD